MPATEENGVSVQKEVEAANNDSVAPPQEVDELGIPKGAKTSEFYRVHQKLPARFDNPDWFQGYRQRAPHPQYRTSNGDYGGKNPNVHTMQTQFHGRSQKFSQHLGVCGMYRNHSFNTYVEKSKVNGVDNLITMEEKNNFHRSYNPNGPAML